jgi:hypothetical protein
MTQDRIKAANDSIIETQDFTYKSEFIMSWMSPTSGFEWIVWEPKREIIYSNASNSIAGVALCDCLIVARQECEGDPAYANIGGRMTVGCLERVY